MNHHDQLLSLLSGKSTSDIPVFSGLIHVTAEGLQSEGLQLNESHHDAQKMARAAMSTFKLTGMPSVTLPLDLCAPAEALGAELKYYAEDEMRFPQVVSDFLFQSAREFSAALTENNEMLSMGRLKIIFDAIALVKKEIGNDVVISGMIPGPYTLLLYLCHPRNLFIEMKKDPQPVVDAVFLLSSFLSKLGTAYRNAGADFITIHEMGGSPGFIGPPKFEQFVFPALKQLISELPVPTVLSVCGNTNRSMELLAQTGASAISVDQTNDLAASRAVLKNTLLFGNLDPVHVLAGGTVNDVQSAARSAINAGVDAVWPGCDLVPQTPIENLKALQA
jgi:[methyl-Co(III) methanol-specific corrinoid protein]:coenzyme M methyltransferase